jgi:superfamily II DNA or RNA helicase
MAGYIASSATARWNVTWIIVHRIELVEQTIKTFSAMGVECGVVAAGYTLDVSAKVQVAMIGTLANRVDKLPPPNLILIDEAHHAVAATWKRLLARFPSVVQIGFTATPERLDGRGLSEQFDELVIGPTPRWLIDNHHLSPYQAFSPASGVGEDDLTVRAGEFATESVVAAMDKPTVTGSAIDEYQKHLAGKRAIVFCASRKHASNVCTAFNAAGIVAEYVDGATPKSERRDAMVRFSAGETLVLVNVDLFAEGVDVPDAVGVILLAHTMSLGKYLQRVGRALRFVAGKVAIIIDHVGSIRRFGLPCAHREWSLEGRKRGKSTPKEIQDMQCQECDGWFPPARVCPGCGHVVPVKERLRFLKHVPGELVEVFIQEMRKDGMVEEHELIRQATMTETEKQDAIEALANKKLELLAVNKQTALAMIPSARSLLDFQVIAKLAGYKSGWAWRRFQDWKSGRTAREEALEKTRAKLGGYEYVRQI